MSDQLDQNVYIQERFDAVNTDAGRAKLDPRQAAEQKASRRERQGAERQKCEGTSKEKAKQEAVNKWAEIESRQPRASGSDHDQKLDTSSAAASKHRTHKRKKGLGAWGVSFLAHALVLPCWRCWSRGNRMNQTRFR